MPNPIDNEELYDRIELAGVRSPGKVTLSGHDRKQTWDIKPADGVRGARTSYKGDQVAQFSATFFLLKDKILGIDDFAAWESFALIIRNSLPKTGKPKALRIYHPDLSANDIKDVSQASIGGMVHDGKGGATVVVEFLEYRPPAPIPAVTLPTPQAKPDPNADVKAENAKLRAEAQKPVEQRRLLF